MKYLILFLFSTTLMAQAPLKKPNRALDQDLKLCVNDGGVEKCPIDIDGATGKLQGTDGLADADNAGLVSGEESGTIITPTTLNWGSAVNTNVHYSKVGKTVSLTIEGIQQVGDGSTVSRVIFDATNFPASLRPPALLELLTPVISASGAIPTNPGRFYMPTTGDYEIRVNATNTNWGATVASNGFFTFSVSWTVL